MLECAAAAGAEMLTDCLGALVAGLVDMQQMPAIGMTGDVLDRDGFAGKRVGHVNHAIGCVGDAVAAMAKPRNNELFSHAQLQAGIRCFHLRQ
jgi:hypothetical protein